MSDVLTVRQEIYLTLLAAVSLLGLAFMAADHCRYSGAWMLVLAALGIPFGLVNLAVVCALFAPEPLPPGIALHDLILVGSGLVVLVSMVGMAVAHLLLLVLIGSACWLFGLFIERTRLGGWLHRGWLELEADVD